MTKIVKYVAEIEESTGKILNVQFPNVTLAPEGVQDGIRTLHITEDLMTDNFMGIGWNPMLYFWNGSSFEFVGNPPNKHAIYDGAQWQWDAEAFMEDIKALRNRKLFQCDWTQVVDAPITDEEKAEWRLYRQELRDFPSTLDNPSSLEELQWPVPPTA